jgi:hypothetical protein
LTGTPQASSICSVDAANVTFQPSSPTTCKLVGGNSYAFVLPGESLGMRSSTKKRDLATGWSISSARPVISTGSQIQFVSAMARSGGSGSWTASIYTSYAMSLEGYFTGVCACVYMYVFMYVCMKE